MSFEKILYLQENNAQKKGHVGGSQVYSQEGSFEAKCTSS